MSASPWIKERKKRRVAKANRLIGAGEYKLARIAALMEVSPQSVKRWKKEGLLVEPRVGWVGRVGPRRSEAEIRDLQDVVEKAAQAPTLMALAWLYAHPDPSLSQDVEGGA